MHIRHFRAPLNEEEAVRFLIACIKGIKRGDPRAAVGHNSTEGDWLENCRTIEKAVGGCDYIGVDLYDGTWSSGGPDTYAPLIDRVWEALGIPVILMEFGFSSLGGMMTDPKGEMIDYLSENGFVPSDLTEKQDAVIAALPSRIRQRVENCAPEDRLGCLLTALPHVRKKWPALCSIAHNEEGQAEFFRALLPKLLAHPHLGGAVIYCNQDSRACFFCGEPDCPCEIAWGLVRADGTLKPAYEAVRAVFGNAHLEAE